MRAVEFAEQFGIGAASFWSLLKATGVTGVIGGLIFLTIKFKLIYLLSVAQATEAVRMKWGVSSYRRSGRLVRLKPGRHIVIRGIYDIVVVSKNEVPLSSQDYTATINKRTLRIDEITYGYTVIAPDTPKGDRLMLRSILSVRDTDRENRTSASLDTKVTGIVLDYLRRYLAEAPRDDDGFPVLDESAMLQYTNEVLKKKHGVRLSSFLFSAMYWTEGQQGYDGNKAIAEAIAKLGPEAVIANVIPIPTTPRAEGLA